ncbi:MAG: MFS transporter [Phycisphaerae bacterium]|nr:MFS transporter [Phycisphaerae bacterium]
MDRLRPAGRALKHRNYRLFFFGQGMSLVGTWTQRVALAWLVYRLTGSELMLGAVGFASQIFTFLLAPFAGVLADRTARRTLLVATQTLAMVQAFLLAGLTLGGVIQPWQILVLSGLLGVINGFDIPIRQSFVVEMLGSREELPNAIAMNSFLVNGARLIGPSLAGFLVAGFGEGVCFLLNGATFLAVIAALLKMRIFEAHHPARHHHPLHNLHEGLVYTFGFAPIRAILLLLATVSLLGVSYTTLMPVFARDILHGGPRMLGLLMAAVGIGAIGGTLFLATRKSVRGLGRVMAAASAFFGAALIAFGFSRNLWLSLALLAAAGFGMMIQFAASNSLLQTLADDDKRGRVMSFYVMAFMGMGPFGALLGGWLARQFGAPTAVMIGGAGCVLGAAVFATRLPLLGKLVHPIYIRLGIVPQPSEEGDEPGVLSPWETRM